MIKKLTLSEDKLQIALTLIRQNSRGGNVVERPVSLLQRHLLLGYGCAVNLVEQLEDLGYLSEPLDDENTREVIREARLAPHQ